MQQNWLCICAGWLMSDSLHLFWQSCLLLLCRHRPAPSIGFPGTPEAALEFVTWSSHSSCRRQVGPASLADKCLSGRTTADFLCTRCTHQSLRAKHAVTCAAYATCSLWTAGHLALEKYSTAWVQGWGDAKFAGFMWTFGLAHTQAAIANNKVLFIWGGLN